MPIWFIWFGPSLWYLFCFAPISSHLVRVFILCRVAGALARRLVGWERKIIDDDGFKRTIPSSFPGFTLLVACLLIS